jgi:hypothetical protein
MGRVVTMPGRRRPDWDEERDVREGLKEAPEPPEPEDEPLTPDQ